MGQGNYFWSFDKVPGKAVGTVGTADMVADKPIEFVVPGLG